MKTNRKFMTRTIGLVLALMIVLTCAVPAAAADYQVVAQPNYNVFLPYRGTQYASAVTSSRVFPGTTGTRITLPTIGTTYFHVTDWRSLTGAGTVEGGRSYCFGTANDTVVPQSVSGSGSLRIDPNGGAWPSDANNPGDTYGVRYMYYDPDFGTGSQPISFLSSPSGGSYVYSSLSQQAYPLPLGITKQNYRLSGWTLESGSSGTLLQDPGTNRWYYIFDTSNPNYVPSASVRAQWTLVNYTLTLGSVGSFPAGSEWDTYSRNGSAMYIEKPYGTVLTLPTASEMHKDGNSFQGWFTLSQLNSNSNIQGATTFRFTKDEELYAKWTPNTYTVTVDLNGGYRTILTATSDYKDYDPYTVSTIYGYWLRLFGNEGPIRRDGYRLVGFTGVNGSSTAGSFINPAENPNLYDDPNNYYYRIGPTDETLVAKWEKIPEDKISVTIGDQIGVNLLLDLDARNAQNVMVVYKDLNGDEKQETFTDFSSLPQVEGGLYKIQVRIAPAQIADSVTVYIDGEQIDANVKDYCNTLIAGGYEPEVAALAQAVLDYGQAANNFFNYTDETISAVTSISADDARAWTPVLSDTTGKIRSVSFMALTKPEFRFYMKEMTEAEAAALNSKITVSGVSGIAARFVKNVQGNILLEVTGLMAENMDETITVTINGLGVIAFAGNDFAKLMANNAATEALGAALYAYGAAAKACFANS